MKLPFAVRLAIRESRATAGRLGIYMGAITLGVAALVAINSFRTAVSDSIAVESKALLGADLRLSSGRAFPDTIAAVLDSAESAGIEIARVTGTLSVALAANGNTRLVQVRAVGPGYPFYGDVVTNPAGLWNSAATSRDLLADPGLLVALDVRIGDTLRIGQAAFRIAGEVTRPPVELGFRSVIAPRVFVSHDMLQQAGLIQFGSLVTYQAYFRIANSDQLQRFVDLNHDRFRRALVNFTSADEEAEELTDAFDWMGRFLGLVGLTALMLGGLGVASAVSVFIKEKRPQIAMLRCLGATRRTAFLAYMFQAAFLGLGGAALGVLIGIVAQAGLPWALGDAIPVTIGFHVYWRHVFAGLGIGVWVATVFSLVPLLDVRNVPPLQALRANVEALPARMDALRAVTWLAVVLSVVLLGILQAPTPMHGLAFAAGLGVAIAALRLVAWALARSARRLLPRNASFAVRQGISGMFRPSNQTAAVTIALGFGVFLIACIWIVQSNLLSRIRPPDAAGSPDLVAFDIQTDQLELVSATFDSLRLERPLFVPIVPAHITELKGRTVDEILSGAEVRDIEPWAVRREYRNTYRQSLASTERLTAGEWWDRAQPDSVPRISIEEDLAASLKLGLGDHVTWEVQGVRIETRIASIRRVDWARFETNFFVVFEPGVLDSLPQTWITLARVPDAQTRAAVQREVARRHPNVSTLDLSLISQTLSSVVGRITLAIRFMAGFAVAGGLVVLAGALAAGRFQRAREAVLLRTLGASRRIVRNAMLTEYAALGALAGLAGVLLGGIAGWGLTHFFFQLPFELPVIPLLALWAIVASLAVIVGAAGHRGLLQSPPLAALREAS
jgi:putative ABC transport system permease protein